MARLAEAAQDRIRELLEENPSRTMEYVFDRCRDEGLTESGPDIFEGFFHRIRDEVVGEGAHHPDPEPPGEPSPAELRRRLSGPEPEAEPPTTDDPDEGWEEEEVDAVDRRAREDGVDVEAELEETRRRASTVRWSDPEELEAEYPGQIIDGSGPPPGTLAHTLQLDTPHGGFSLHIGPDGGCHLHAEVNLEPDMADRIVAILLAALYGPAIDAGNDIPLDLELGEREREA